MSLPSNGIGPDDIRQAMPAYHFSPDLLEATLAALPPPPPGAPAAWRQARLARLMQEISTLMPANASQARMAAEILIARGMADAIAARAYAPDLTVPQMCRVGRASGELMRTATAMVRTLERTQLMPAPFFGTVLADEVDIAAVDAGWGKRSAEAEVARGAAAERRAAAESPEAGERREAARQDVERREATRQGVAERREAAESPHVAESSKAAERQEAARQEAAGQEAARQEGERRAWERRAWERRKVAAERQEVERREAECAAAGEMTAWPAAAGPAAAGMSGSGPVPSDAPDQDAPARAPMAQPAGQAPGGEGLPAMPEVAEPGAAMAVETRPTSTIGATSETVEPEAINRETTPAATAARRLGEAA